jgi:hypothetical protein
MIYIGLGMIPATGQVRCRGDKTAQQQLDAPEALHT